MRSPDRLAWPLIAATALVAMVAGHAAQLWLENLRVFGEERAAYAHSAQSFAIEAGAALFVVAVALLARQLLRQAAKPSSPVDALLPALHGIVRSGVGCLCLAVVSLQLVLLVVTELAEQRVSGFTGNGMLAIVGPGHTTAIAVHLVIGLLAALALFRASRILCAQSRTLVRVFTVFLRRSRPVLHPSPLFAHRASHIAPAGRGLEVLALGIANRPPPSTSALAA